MQVYIIPKNGEEEDGMWFDVTTDADEMTEEVNETLGTEEWDIGETDPEIKESTIGDLEELCELADIIGDNDEDAFIAWLNYNGDIEHVKKYFEDAYCGEFRNAEDFAREEITSIYNIDPRIECYIDWESLGEDLGIDYDYVDAQGGGIYVFRQL